MTNSVSQIFTRPIPVDGVMYYRPDVFYIGPIKESREVMKRLILDHGGKVSKNLIARGSNVIPLVDPFAKASARGPPIYSITYINACVEKGERLDKELYLIKPPVNPGPKCFKDREKLKGVKGKGRPNREGKRERERRVEGEEGDEHGQKKRPCGENHKEGKGKKKVDAKTVPEQVERTCKKQGEGNVVNEDSRVVERAVANQTDKSAHFGDGKQGDISGRVTPTLVGNGIKETDEVRVAPKIVQEKGGKTSGGRSEGKVGNGDSRDLKRAAHRVENGNGNAEIEGDRVAPQTVQDKGGKTSGGRSEGKVGNGDSRDLKRAAHHVENGNGNAEIEGDRVAPQTVQDKGGKTSGGRSEGKVGNGDSRDLKRAAHHVENGNGNAEIEGDRVAPQTVQDKGGKTSGGRSEDKVRNGDSRDLERVAHRDESNKCNNHGREARPSLRKESHKEERSNDKVVSRTVREKVAKIAKKRSAGEPENQDSQDLRGAAEPQTKDNVPQTSAAEHRVEKGSTLLEEHGPGLSNVNQGTRSRIMKSIEMTQNNDSLQIIEKKWTAEEDLELRRLLAQISSTLEKRKDINIASVKKLRTWKSIYLLDGLPKGRDAVECHRRAEELGLGDAVIKEWYAMKLGQKVAVRQQARQNIAERSIDNDDAAAVEDKSSTPVPTPSKRGRGPVKRGKRHIDPRKTGSMTGSLSTFKPVLSPNGRPFKCPPKNETQLKIFTIVKQLAKRGNVSEKRAFRALRDERGDCNRALLALREKRNDSRQ